MPICKLFFNIKYDVNDVEKVIAAGYKLVLLDQLLQRLLYCTVISLPLTVVRRLLSLHTTGLSDLGFPISSSDSVLHHMICLHAEHIFPAPANSPFLRTDSLRAPDLLMDHHRQEPLCFYRFRWRSRVTKRPSSSSEFPIASVTAPPRIRRRLAWRHASPRSSDHHPSSSSSSSDSSPVHSLGLDAPDQAHSGSSTRDVFPRLGYPPRRAPRCKSSSGDSSERPLHSSSHSARPSSKRGRSQVDSVPSSTPVMGSLAPTRADLLPPRKRFRDSYSSEASIEEDTEIVPIETEVDMKFDIGDGDDVRDHVEIDPRDVKDDTEEYEADTSAGDTVEVGIDPMSFEDMPIDLDDAVRDFYHHMSELKVLENLKVRAMLDIERDRVNSLRLHMSLSQEEFRQVRRDRDDTRGRLRRTITNTRSVYYPSAIEEMINQRVDAALEARRVNRDLELGNGNDNGGDGNGDGNGNGTGNGNNGGDNSGGNENRNVNGRG
ncbi:hypothetical protein Tco_0562321 [Tanacetum coccineum]